MKNVMQDSHIQTATRGRFIIGVLLTCALAMPLTGFATERPSSDTMVALSATKVVSEANNKAEAAQPKEEIPQTKLVLEEVSYPATANSATKKYESYTAITARGTLNYQLLHGEDVIHTDNGPLLVDDCYAVAMGQQFGVVGDKFLVTLADEEGETHQIKIIMCDTKANKDTLGGAGWFGGDGHIIEVIVDMSKLDATCRQWGNLNYLDTFHGTVTKIEKIVGEETYYVTKD